MRVNEQVSEQQCYDSLMVPDRLKNLCSMLNQVIDLKQITAWASTLHPAGHRTPPAISGITHVDIRMKYKKDEWSHLLNYVKIAGSFKF